VQTSGANNLFVLQSISGIVFNGPQRVRDILKMDPSATAATHQYPAINHPNHRRLPTETVHEEKILGMRVMDSVVDNGKTERISNNIYRNRVILSEEEKEQ
jgi:hypothetical protein